MSSLVIKVTPSSDSIQVADALELAALVAPDMQASQCELMGIMSDESDSENGSLEGDYDAIFDSAFMILQERGDMLGGYYPFIVESGVVSLRPNATTSPYVFLLLLSWLRGKAPNHKQAAKIFEHLSGAAIQGYIGGEGLIFGSPRETMPKGFRDAIGHMVSGQHLNEGRPCFQDPKTSDQQDAHLDVVAWRHFPDRKPGKLIIFGQCNTGQDNSKSSELNPIRWNKRWLSGSLSPDPIAAYFVPWCVEQRDWQALCSEGGILFERLRITIHSPARVDAELLERIGIWNLAVLNP